MHLCDMKKEWCLKIVKRATRTQSYFVEKQYTGFTHFRNKTK